MSDSIINEPTNTEDSDIKKRTVRRRRLAGGEGQKAVQPAETPAGLTEDNSLFFSVPTEQDEEEPAFGELIFGEKISEKKVDVKLKQTTGRKHPPKKEVLPPSEEDLFAEEEEEAERLRRKQEARQKRKEQLRKELEEQLKKEREEQQRLQEEAERERRRQEEKIRREQEKQEEKARKEKEKQEAKIRKEEERQEAKIRREQIRQTAEYRRKVKIRRIVLGCVLIAVLIAAGVFLVDRYVKLNGCSITASVEMTNLDANSEIRPYQDGYVKIAGDGVTYFNSSGIIWSEGLSMADPLFDVCGEYIAVSDMKSTEVSVYGPKGFLNKFSLSRVATDIEVSEFGSVAAATNEGDSNFIELKDQTGADIATVKTVFSSTGYLADIALSPNGAQLAAAYILVADGNIESKVVFYDFSKNMSQGEDITVGEFTQYKSTLITSLHFMDGNRVAAIGDNAFTIYQAGSTPSIVYEELDYPWQINSLFVNNRYIGFIVENNGGEDAYAIKVYNLSGKLVCDQSFDFAYNHASFAGRSVLLYSNYDCDVFNFAGTHKFSYTFDNRIFTMESCGDNINYILLTQGQTQFIRLR